MGGKRKNIIVNLANIKAQPTKKKSEKSPVHNLQVHDLVSFQRGKRSKTKSIGTIIDKPKNHHSAKYLNAHFWVVVNPTDGVGKPQAGAGEELNLPASAFTMGDILFHDQYKVVRVARVVPDTQAIQAVPLIENDSDKKDFDGRIETGTANDWIKLEVNVTRLTWKHGKSTDTVILKSTKVDTPNTCCSSRKKKPQTMDVEVVKQTTGAPRA